MTHLDPAGSASDHSGQPAPDPAQQVDYSQYEDPAVTAAFAALAAAQDRANRRTGRVKVSHLLLLAAVLAVLPAVALWALGPAG